MVLLIIIGSYLVLNEVSDSDEVIIPDYNINQENLIALEESVDEEYIGNYIDSTEYLEESEDIPQEKDKEECDDFDVAYLYTDYDDYQSLASIELEDILNIGEFEDGTYYSGRNNYFGSYGEREGVENKRGCGEIYFLLYKHGEWDTTRYWAIEANVETGELVRWEEISIGTNDFDESKFWWIN